MNKLYILFLSVFSLVGCTHNSKITNTEKETEVSDSLQEETIIERDTLKTLLREEVPVNTIKEKPEAPKKKRITDRAIQSEIVEEVVPLIVVDTLGQRPHFRGGDTEMYKYINQNLKYPIIAQENGIQGRVIVQFTIKTDGSITDIHIKRGIDPSCDKEAIRVVKGMPKWLPAKQNGKPIEVSYMIPIIFKLNY